MSNTAPLSVEELEAGLLMLDQGIIAPGAFWDANLIAFRQAMLIAIHETSGLLRAKRLPPRWRRELQVQLRALHGYVEIVDCYAARRAGGRPGARLH